MQSLKAVIILEHNGEKISKNEFNFDNLLNKGIELESDYVLNVLRNLSLAATRRLQRLKIAYPFETTE